MGLASVEEVKAKLAIGGESAQDALTALISVDDSLSTAIDQIIAVSDGTTHAKLPEGVRALQQAKSKCKEMQAAVRAGYETANEYATTI